MKNRFLVAGKRRRKMTMQEKIKLLIAEDNGYLSSNIKDFMACLLYTSRCV